MSRAHAALCAAALFVAGCAAPPLAPPVAPSVEPNLWTGRFSVTYTQGGYQPREERVSGRFTLYANDERQEIELASPLGQTIAEVGLEAGEATLVASDGRRAHASSAEELTERIFGWRIPIGELPKWLRGSVEHVTRRHDGRVVAGVDDDWAVRFDSFDGDRPRTLALAWPADRGDGLRQIDLRLVVDSASRVSRAPIARGASGVRAAPSAPIR